MFSWHAVGVKQILEHLHTSEVGLGAQQAAVRLAHFGPNEISVKRDSLWKVIVQPFISAFVLVLLAAVAISLFNKEYIDAVIIGAVIMVNAIIFYVQSYTTNRVLRSLKKHNRQAVEVIRNGASSAIDAQYLVPGDIIVISEGQKIPADARVIDTDNLQLNESSLTGESLPVAKNSATLSADKAVFERHNMLYQGTFVVSGAGRAVVVATGLKTEFGRVAQLAGKGEDKSPVQQKIDNLVSKLIKYLAAVAAGVFLLALYRGIPNDEAFRFVLSLIVAAVPEGLPVALTVIIVLGMRRMAQKNALVRSLKAIEDIGQVTTIATDKTGTLTQNHLRVVDYWPSHDPKFKDHLAKTISGKQHSADALDTALDEYVDARGAGTAVETYPFDQSLRISAACWKERGRYAIYIKGAPEHILNMSHLNQADRHKAESHLHTFAAEGYRVLGVARIYVSDPPAKLQDIAQHRLHFLGFVAFADEIRPETYQAIKEAQLAGINIKLITGDHFETAFNVAKKIGVALHPSQVITGADLPRDEAALAAVGREKTVFARILPEDKFRILKVLKKTEITAMTGDGVNDVPALANAHVGIAMGSGSDIAKDAGDIVLLDNNFASIIKAIGEGRVIYDNIRRMLLYLLSTNLAIVLTVTGAMLLGMPLPLTAIQILWINLVTDTAMVLPLGLEPPEKDHMKQPPRRVNEPILSNALIARIFLSAIVMAAVTLAAVATLDSQGYELAYIQTVAFMTLITAQWMNAFNSRSEKESLLSRLRHPNHGLTVGLAFAVGLQLLVLIGPLGSWLKTEITVWQPLLISISASVLAIFITVEIHKAWTKLSKRKQIIVNK